MKTGSSGSVPERRERPLWDLISPRYRGRPYTTGKVPPSDSEAEVEADVKVPVPAPLEEAPKGARPPTAVPEGAPSPLLEEAALLDEVRRPFAGEVVETMSREDGERRWRERLAHQREAIARASCVRGRCSAPPLNLGAGT
jgi:hypothetical protein